MSKMIPLRIADMAVAACNAEIQKLREENARLKAVDIIVQATVSVGKTPVLYLAKIDRLKAQVERLTKAGDAMAKEWINCESLYHGNEDFIAAWNAAKEGKQP